jgi:hypothetical protein
MWTIEKKTAFLSNSSLLGIVAIKALIEATAQDKYCDLRTLFDAQKTRNFEYVYGFFICASAVDLFKYEFPEEKTMSNGKARMKKPSDDLIRLVAEEWSKRANSDDPVKQRSCRRYEPKISESLADISTHDA